MEPEIVSHATIALVLVLKLSLPPVIAATLVGLLVSIFQTITQIQEQTLVYGVKLIAVTITILFTIEWIGSELVTFSDQVMEAFPVYSR